MGIKYFTGTRNTKAGKGPQQLFDGQDDGQIVLVQHGGCAHYGIYPSHLMKATKSGSETKEGKNTKAKSSHVSKTLYAHKHNFVDKVLKANGESFPDEEVVEENDENGQELLSDEELVEENGEGGEEAISDDEQENC